MRPKPELTNFHGLVWKTLSRIEVSDHVEYIGATAKRPAVAYLPWSKAWTLVKREFPGSTYSHKADIWHPDNTVEVEVVVHISDGSVEGSICNARLAVMDSYFNPISNPHAREINDARQRALVKALAFAGLGLNLWSDSMIPVGKLNDPISVEQQKQILDLLQSTESDFAKFYDWCGIEALEEMPVERFDSAVKLLEAKARRVSARKQAEEKSTTKKTTAKKAKKTQTKKESDDVAG